MREVFNKAVTGNVILSHKKVGKLECLGQNLLINAFLLIIAHCYFPSDVLRVKTQICSNVRYYLIIHELTINYELTNQNPLALRW